jgi:thiol-disulfide isomerase/thioredoxin
MKKCICCLLLLLPCLAAFCQFWVKGQVHNLRQGHYTIHIYELTGPAPQAIFVDSFTITAKGAFSGSIQQQYAQGTLFKATLYRNGLAVNPLEDAGLDNSFIFTNTGNSGITLHAPADTTFFAAALQTTNAASKQITALEQWKKPLYKMMFAQSGKASQMDSQKFYTKFITAVNKYRQQLMQQLSRQIAPEAALVCLYNLNLIKLGSIAPIDTALLNQHLSDKQLPRTALTAALLVPLDEQAENMGKQIGDIAILSPKNITTTIQQIAAADTITVISCWASWCGPCRKGNRQYLPGFAKKLAAKGIPFFSVSIDTDLKKWRKAIAEDGIKWPQYADAASRDLYTRLRINGTPYYIVINRQGQIIFETHAWLQLNEYITKLSDKNKGS